MMQPNTTLYAYSQHISSSSDLNDLYFMLLIQWLHYFSLFFKNGLSSKWVREIATIYQNFLLQVVTTWKGWTTMEVLNPKNFLPFTFHLRTSTSFLTFYIPLFISHIFSHPRTCKNHAHILNMGMIKKL